MIANNTAPMYALTTTTTTSLFIPTSSLIHLSSFTQPSKHTLTCTRIICTHARARAHALIHAHTRPTHTLSFSHTYSLTHSYTAVICTHPRTHALTHISCTHSQALTHTYELCTSGPIGCCRLLSVPTKTTLIYFFRSPTLHSYVYII